MMGRTHTENFVSAQKITMAVRNCSNLFSLAWWTLAVFSSQQCEVGATAVHVPGATERRATLSGGKHVNGQPPLSYYRGGANVDVNPKLLRRFDDDSRMPSLFLPEESLYDRYAACLAATEGLRRLRDRKLAEEAVMEQAGYRTSREADSGEMTELEKQITAQYVQNSRKVLRSLGMTVNQFNELGKRVAQDGSLREKVGCWSGAFFLSGTF